VKWLFIVFPSTSSRSAILRLAPTVHRHLKLRRITVRSASVKVCLGIWSTSVNAVSIVRKITVVSATSCRRVFRRQDAAATYKSDTYFSNDAKLKTERPDWTILIGPEAKLAEAHRLGGDGGVNGGASVAPGLFVDCHRVLCRGDGQKVAEILTHWQRSLSFTDQHGDPSRPETGIPVRDSQWAPYPLWLCRESGSGWATEGVPSHGRAGDVRSWGAGHSSEALPHAVCVRRAKRL
jgi:hypothetical protein